MSNLSNIDHVLKQAVLQQVLNNTQDFLKLDPILSHALVSRQVAITTELRKKAKILVKDSAVLMGVVDEDGILGEDEVFVQLKRDNFRMESDNKKPTLLKLIEKVDSLPEVIESEVYVTRNPCTHPGDIRRLKCVYKPELSHLYNVIVFSSKGARPQQDMMSGGDLDGDEFFVTWDKGLLSHEVIL